MSIYALPLCSTVQRQRQQGELPYGRITLEKRKSAMSTNETIRSMFQMAVKVQGAGKNHKYHAPDGGGNDYTNIRYMEIVARADCVAYFPAQSAGNHVVGLLAMVI